jgi:hypothetical protein
VICTVNAFPFLDSGVLQLLVTGPVTAPIASVDGQMVVLGPAWLHEGIRIDGQALLGSFGAGRLACSRNDAWIGSAPLPKGTQARLQVTDGAEIRTGTISWERPPPAAEHEQGANVASLGHARGKRGAKA